MPTWAKRCIGLLVILVITGLAPLHAVTADAAPADPTESSFGVQRTSAGFTLNDSATLPPPSLSSFARYGLFESAIVAPASRFSGVRASFTIATPLGTQAMVMVRSRDIDGRWDAWATDVQPGQTISFDRVMRQVQYRVVLLGSATASPRVTPVQFEPLTNKLSTVQEQDRGVAPTYRLRITRQGMVGGRTANGHIITKNDVFVSLPSWSSLSSKGGREYQVRLSANGRSVIAPVYDVGPWNHHDNYWDQKRETYKDLPTGWPEDHAAYYENYNRRVADEGWVRFPTAVDIGDGAYWALGLKGAQGVVDVTFLWLGDDPGPNATPRNSDPSQRPRASAEQPPAATPADPATPREPAPTDEPAPAPTPIGPDEVVVAPGGTGFDTNVADWQWHQATCGNQPSRWLATNKGDWQAGLWRPELKGGTYQVQVHVPLCAGSMPTTQEAKYVVHGAKGEEQTITVNQATNADGWVTLGDFAFGAGSDGFVKLSSDAPGAGHAVWFDSIRWTRVSD